MVSFCETGLASGRQQNGKAETLISEVGEGKWEKGEILGITVTSKQSAQAVRNSKQCFCGDRPPELSETAFVELYPAFGALQQATLRFRVCKNSVLSEDANCRTTRKRTGETVVAQVVTVTELLTLKGRRDKWISV
jgi:hypothetical protein